MVNVVSYSINISALRNVQKTAGTATDRAPFASPSEGCGSATDTSGLTVGVGKRAVLSPDPLSSSTISTTGDAVEMTVGCKRSEGTGLGTSSHQFSLVVSAGNAIGKEGLVV